MLTIGEGLSGWFDILIATIIIRGYFLLSQTFLSLSNNILMILSTDIPH